MLRGAGERRPLEVTRPSLTQLTESLGERAHLSFLQGPRVLTLPLEAPAQAIQTVGWVGRVVLA